MNNIKAWGYYHTLMHFTDPIFRTLFNFDIHGIKGHINMDELMDRVKDNIWEDLTNVRKAFDAAAKLMKIFKGKLTEKRPDWKTVVKTAMLPITSKTSFQYKSLTFMIERVLLNDNPFHPDRVEKINDEAEDIIDEYYSEEDSSDSELSL